MRKDWEYKKLGEVAFYPNDKISVDKIGANHYVGVENLLKDKAGILFSDQLPNAATATCFKYNDILLGNIRPYLKKIWLSNTEGGASGDVIVIRTSSDNILPNYLFKLLSSDKFFNYFNLYTKGAKMPRGDKNAIAKFIVPTPPKPTQLAIVAELDKINELIQLKKEQLKDYDQLAQSIFYEMFGDPVENEKGWEVKKLGEIALEKMSYGSGASAVPYNQKIRYIRITDIDELGCLKKDIVSPNICEDKYLLSDGDILFARSGATVGKTFLFKSTYGSCIYAGYLIRLRPNTQIVIPEYVYHYTKTHYYRSFIESNQRVVAQPNINAQQYSSLKLPLPPLPLQQQFAARIEAIERQKQQVSETIKDLETLLASRMQYWFD